MNAFKQVMMVALVWVLPGCLVGPNYHRPCVNLPDAYAAGSANKVAQLACWWTFFNDDCLNSLIEQALKNNYGLQIALEKIEETRNQYQIARADLFPQVYGNAQINRTLYSRELAQNTLLSSGRELSYFQLGLDALWEIDIFGGLRRAYNAAYDDYEAQIESMRDVYIMLLGDVAQAYINARALQRSVMLLEQTKLVDEQLLLLAKDRWQAGIASELPYVQQQQQLDETTSMLILTQTQLQQTLNRLAYLLSKNPEDFNLCSGNVQVPMSVKELAPGLPSELLCRRPDIRKAERLLAAATERVGVAMSDMFPKFPLLANVASETNKSSQWLSKGSFSWSIGPNIVWPLITFGRIQYNIQVKKSQQRQALLAYANSVVNALTDVENSLIAYFNAQERVKILQDKFQAAGVERDLSKSLFEAGLDSETAYLVAQKNCFEIELELTSAQQAVSMALIFVYKALGGGW